MLKKFDTATSESKSRTEGYFITFARVGPIYVNQNLQLVMKRDRLPFMEVQIDEQNKELLFTLTNESSGNLEVYADNVHWAFGKGIKSNALRKKLNSLGIPHGRLYVEILNDNQFKYKF